MLRRHSRTTKAELRRSMPDAARFSLRAARPADGDAVARMCMALARHEGGATPALTAAAFRRDGFGPDPAFHCILAERRSVPAGYAIYLRDYDTELLCHSTYMADLYVETAARRCGIGRALMAAAAREARGWDAQALCWNVMRTNGSARAFYGPLGRELPDMVLCSTDRAGFDRLADAAAPPGITLRRGAVEDAARLGGMLAALLADEGADPPADDLAARLAADGFGARPAFACHLAEGKGRALGYALHWPIYDTEPASRGVYLSDLYVAPAAWRSGIARALLGAAARDGRRQGARYMEWRVRRDNLAARAVCATLGEEDLETVPMVASGEAFERLAAAGADI